MLHAYEPLKRQTRFYGNFGAFRQTDIVGIVFFLFKQTGFAEVVDNGLAAVEAVHADIHACDRCYSGVFVEDIDGLEIVLLAQHVVVLVVRRSHFETAGTEFDFHIPVFDYRNDAVHQRNNHLAPLEPCVFEILGIDAHRCVAHNGLGTGGGDNGIVAAVVVGMHNGAFGGLERCRFLCQIIAEIVEFRLFFHEEYLVVADCGAVDGIPVHHAQVAVDKTFVEKVDKDAVDSVGALFVHSECGAVPVAGSTELTELLQDDAAVFAGPLPGMLKELLACEVGLFDSFRSKLLDNLCLGGYGRMVGAGHPAGVFALHARAAHEDVLDCIVEHMPHVEDAGDVWRRDHYGVSFALVGLGMEQLVFKPVGIPFVLYVGRIVFLWEVVHCLSVFFAVQNY